MLIRIVFFFLCMNICAVAAAQTPMYRINKIKTVGKYYIIYAVKNDSVYKIVSKKEKMSGCRKIRKNESYPFKFSKIQSLAGSEVDCFSFDSKTTICKEPDIELGLVSNLKGLHFIEK